MADEGRAAPVVSPRAQGGRSKADVTGRVTFAERGRRGVMFSHAASIAALAGDP